jgi:glutathione S-transferase
MPAMTLFFSHTSPFARKIMVLLHETGQLADVTVQEVALSPVMPSAELNTVNPAGKIPALRLADGSHLHDSRVIFEYLDQRHAGPSLVPAGPQRWSCLTLASLADAALDAAILVRYETFLRPADKRWDAWLQGQQEKVERALASFEQAIGTVLGSRFDLAAISVACALGYIDLRQPELDWRSRYPQLASWYTGISQRPSLQATQPPQ